MDWHPVQGVCLLYTRLSGDMLRISCKTNQDEVVTENECINK